MGKRAAQQPQGTAQPQAAAMSCDSPMADAPACLTPSRGVAAAGRREQPPLQSTLPQSLEQRAQRQDALEQTQRVAESPRLPAPKKVKKEHVAESPSLGEAVAVPTPKRPRQAKDAQRDAAAAAPVATTAPARVATAPSPARGGALVAASAPALAGHPARSGAGGRVEIGAGHLQRSRDRAGGIAWVLSEVRADLEKITDVEGVPELLDSFPSCVLLGGIAARRELVAALLGEHGLAQSAAALIVAPGMRQPLALELRGTSAAIPDDQAEAWLRDLSSHCASALGHRLKVETLRLRLSAQGCCNLDVIDLPEAARGAKAEGSSQAKAEEIRTKHLGSPSNVLVCLEPGVALDLCRRFDPGLKRTALIGAAAASLAAGGDALPASTLCGSAAARALEDRFAVLCRERMPQWLESLNRLEVRMARAQREARDVENREAEDEVLRHARATGLSFGRALQHVVSGAPGCSAGALTLEDELRDFAEAAAKGLCGTNQQLKPQDAARSAADLFSNFDGVEGYAAYLRNEIKIPGADVPLNGGAAWQRLLAEVEVAMRLAHPPPEELQRLMLAAIRVGGTGVHGHKRWEDVASKLMLTVSYAPLQRRVRYIAARVVWALKHLKTAVSEWMSTLTEGPSARLYSPLFAQHLGILRKYPIVRDLVFTAYDDAASGMGEQVLKNLQGTLMAACINPEIMLRPSTEPKLDPSAEEVKPTPMSGRSKESRQRVSQEMTRRSGRSGGLPVQLRDRIFEPSEAAQTLPFVEVQLRRAFSVLSNILASQAFAFADSSMSTLCNCKVDEAMSNIDFSPEQRGAVAARHMELEAVAKQVEDRLRYVRRCLSVLRTAR